MCHDDNLWMWQQQEEELHRRYLEECQQQQKQDEDFETWLDQLDKPTPNGLANTKKPITNCTEKEI